MTDTDQCIVCLEDLPGGPCVGVASAPSGSATPELTATASTAEQLTAAQPPAAAVSDTTTPTTLPTDNSYHVAVIEACGHTLHDECLQSWSSKANTCPICRKTFHKVTVFNHIGGTEVNSYCVEDKKQTIEFDPTWLLAVEEDREEYGDDIVAGLSDDEYEDDDEEQHSSAPAELDPSPCNTCHLSDFANSVILNCQVCGRGFHAECVSIEDEAPLDDSSWTCTDCHNSFEWGLQDLNARQSSTRRANRARQARTRRHSSRPLSRPQGGIRPRRRLSRRRGWHGFWPQGPLSEISSVVFDRLNLEIEYPPDEDLERFRRIQRLEERFRQRADIAARAGGAASSRQYSTRGRTPAAAEPQDPEEVRQRRDESMSWSALATAKRADEQVSWRGAPVSSSSRSRPENGDNRGKPLSGLKRRASIDEDASNEPERQPERKLKRPRTRRLPEASEVNKPSTGPSADKGKATEPLPPSLSIRPKAGDQPQRPAIVAIRQSSPPSFLSSLLEEIEQQPGGPASTSSISGRAGSTRASDLSPASSPPPSDWGSPMSRPSSPPLSLSSHLAPVYPKANYRPPHSAGSRQPSDEEVRSQRVKQKEMTEKTVAHAIARGATS